MRSICCRFVAVLPILTFFSVLALAQGTTPSQTNLFPAAGSSGQIGFAVNVRPGPTVKPPFATPTGMVTLYNGATAVGSPAALSANSGFTSATFAQVFGTPDATVAKAAGGAVWGDFNEDGAPDLLVYGEAPGPVGQALVVQVFTANTVSSPVVNAPSFTPLAAQQLALPLQMQFGQTLAVLDVDGDGHLDLLAGSTVAYGKGDGSFGRVAVLPALATGYNQTYAVDIDGDGKMDIVAVDTPPAVSAPGTVQYAFTVFHNAGGGNFTLQGPFQLAPPFTAGSSVAYNIFGLSFADVNGDGHIDVLSQSNVVPAGNAAEPARLNVMLNLGGFSAPKPIDTSAILDENVISMAFADLNGDGKQDLVFSYQANTMNNGMATLLGNGDGTFAAPANFTIGNTLTVGSALLPLATEDVNADGKTDVVLGSGVLLLGKGDGTLTTGTPLFTSAVTPLTAPPAYALLTAPSAATIPGGEDDPFFALVYINLQSGANAVFIPNIGSSATVTALLAPGTYSLTAHYPGDATYAAGVSSPVTITVTPPAPPTVTITSSANPIYASQPVTFTATLSDPTIAGSITFADISKNDDNPLDPMAGSTEAALGTGTISNGVATLTTKLLVGGAHTIIAVYGPDIFAPIAQAQLTETVNLPFAVNVSNSGILLTASSGQSATATIPIQALGGFTGQVTFGCVNGEPTCSFSPATVNLSGTGTTNVTLTVTAASSTPTSAATFPAPSVVLAFGLPLFTMLGFAGGGRRSVLFLVFALALCVIPFTGCGGGSSSSGSSTSSNSLKPGTYLFDVTATSGQNVQVLQGTLTVQ